MNDLYKQDITFEFACRDDCLDKMVPSDLRRLVVQRDEAREFAEEAAKKYNELLASNRVTCVYCGHQYAEGTPEANHIALTAHIAQCESHPMRQLGAALCAMMRMPFPPTAAALKEMRLGIACMAEQAPCGDDVKIALAALDALRVFLPNNKPSCPAEAGSAAADG